MLPASRKRQTETLTRIDYHNLYSIYLSIYSSLLVFRHPLIGSAIQPQSYHCLRAVYLSICMCTCCVFRVIPSCRKLGFQHTTTWDWDQLDICFSEGKILRLVGYLNSLSNSLISRKHLMYVEKNCHFEFPLKCCYDQIHVRQTGLVVHFYWWNLFSSWVLGEQCVDPTRCNSMRESQSRCQRYCRVRFQLGPTQ